MTDAGSDHRTRYHWSRTCPMCDGQGRLLIFVDTTANRLYLHCGECEWGWRDPSRSGDTEAAFLTLDEEFEARPANRADIEEHGWTEYAVYEFEE